LRTCRGRDTPLRTCRGRALNMPCKGRAMNDLKPAGLKGPVLGPVFYISYSLYMFIYRGSQRASLESPRASLPLKPPVFRVAEASRDSPGLKYIVSRSVSLEGTLPYCSVSLKELSRIVPYHWKELSRTPARTGTCRHSCRAARTQSSRHVHTWLPPGQARCSTHTYTV
jgi:hypothetical protein